MELTQSDYTRPGGRHIAIRIDGKTVVFVEQNMHIDNPAVWDAPYIFVNHEKVTELEYLDLLKDALLNRPVYARVAMDAKVQTELGDTFATAISAHWAEVEVVRSVLKAAKDSIKLSEGDEAHCCDIHRLWRNVHTAISSVAAATPWRQAALDAFTAQYADTRRRTSHEGKLWDLQQMLDPRQLGDMLQAAKLGAVVYAVQLARTQLDFSWRSRYSPK